MHRAKAKIRKLAALTLASAALLFASPAPAQASQANVSGTVCTCGTWAYYDNPRTVSRTGNISLAMTDKTSGSTYIALRNRATHSTSYFFTDTRTFSSTGTQIIGSNVLATTTFYMNARMPDITGGNNYWAGLLTWP